MGQMGDGVVIDGFVETADDQHFLFIQADGPGPQEGDALAVYGAIGQFVPGAGRQVVAVAVGIGRIAAAAEDAQGLAEQLGDALFTGIPGEIGQPFQCARFRS